MKLCLSYYIIVNNWHINKYPMNSDDTNYIYWQQPWFLVKKIIHNWHLLHSPIKFCYLLFTMN